MKITRPKKIPMYKYICYKCDLIIEELLAGDLSHDLHPSKPEYHRCPECKSINRPSKYHTKQGVKK